MSENNSSFWGALLAVLYWIYGIVASISTIVFFIEYCKEWDSIIKIIFLGPILSALKGMLWIIYIW
jgi:hypothetical protein